MKAARWVILIFALTYPTAMTWLYFTENSSDAPLLYAFGKCIQFALPVAWWLGAEGKRLRLPAPSWNGIAVGSGFGLLVGAGVIALYFGWLRGPPEFGILKDLATAKAAHFGLTTPVKFLAFAVFLSAIHALLEEYYWRAFVFAELRKQWPLAPAVVVSSLGFMAHHVVVLAVYFPGQFWRATVPLSAGVAIGGAVWAIMYVRYGTLYSPWIGHALVDASLMGVAYAVLWT
jgi:CAAX protease family protein